MKKSSLFLSTLIIIFFAFSLVVSANEQSVITNDDNPNDLLYDGLNPGEKVVEFYREIMPIDEVEPSLDSRLDNEITPFERTRRWYPMTKVYMGHYYGSWKYAGASTQEVFLAHHTQRQYLIRIVVV